MFERYLAEALATHFSHIISNFDADKVKFSVWNGEVILRDLTLKENALQQLEKTKAGQGVKDLPFKISHGHIGTFELRIPWKLLRLSKNKKSNKSKATVPLLGKKSKNASSSIEAGSCSLILSDVNILISPGVPELSTDEDGDKNGNDQNQQQTQTERIKKERVVQNILDEALFRKNIESELAQANKNAQAENDASDKSFVKNLVQNILSSLTITVRNVHIRYEDPGDCIGFDTKQDFNSSKQKIRHRPPFAVGVALEEFCLGNIDYGPEEDDKLYRIPDMQGFSRKNDDDDESFQEVAAREVYSIQHKLAAATALLIYWDSSILSSDLIHLMVRKRVRWKRRKQLRANKYDDKSFSSDDDEDDNHMDNIVGRSDLEDEGEWRGEFYSAMMYDALSLNDSRRTYIIQPISPSLHCTIVRALNGSNSEHGDNALPPSRAVLTLPSSQMNVTKDTLEDIAYIRRSFALWNEMKTSMLTRKVFEELTRARPNVSPLEDPRRWWRYAFEAVRTLSRIEEENENIPKKRKGWLGVTESLKTRKRYISMYKSFLGPNTITVEEKEELNSALCTLEDSLQPAEVVAFRVDAVSEIINTIRSSSRDKNTQGAMAGQFKTLGWWGWGNSDANPYPPKEDLQHALFDEKEMLTVRYRETIHLEMMAALDLEEELGYAALFSKDEGKKLKSTGLLLLEENVKSGSNVEVTVLCPQIVLQIDDVISERIRTPYSAPMTSQKMNRRRNPVVQLRCASVQKLCFHRDSVWDVTSTFASLEMLDIMESSYSLSDCPRLVTRKRSWVSQGPNSSKDDPLEKSVLIGDISHTHGGTVFVKKRPFNGNETKDSSVQSEGTAITVIAKLSPMEIVYAPETLQTLSAVFSTAKTTELAVDYNRLVHAVSNWKAQQKERLIQVLSQSEERFFANIDIAAPVFLMHDKTSNGTLVVDLGRLSFRDANEGTKRNKEYDDTWNLSLQNIQVLTMPRPEGVSLSTYNLVHHKDICHLVEPFSLDFIIGTKFFDQNSEGMESKILIDATLPRLVFNLSSSAVRLVHRLNEYRRIRKSRLKSRNVNQQGRQLERDASASQGALTQIQEERGTSVANFNFSAPLIAFRLINDVDGRDSAGSDGLKQTPIAELAMRGIGGELSRIFVKGRKINTTFNARLKSLYAHDLYQQAGSDFFMLLSSQLPSYKSSGDQNLSSGSSISFSDSNLEPESAPQPNLDLVCVQFHDNETFGPEGSAKKMLNIEFHELYVEWNPETIAAIQKSLRLSLLESDFFLELEKTPGMDSLNLPAYFASNPLTFGESYSAEESVAFFDAVEDEQAATFSDNDVFLSEASSAEDNTVSSSDPRRLPSPILSPMVVKAMKALSIRQLNLDDDDVNHLERNDEIDKSMNSPAHRPEPTFNLCFQLSKLRVRFNKESRLRRLIVAEMTKTLIQYKSKPFGGGETVASLGNFTLKDPSADDGSTLYGEILGLKSDAEGSESLLKITRETFPRDEESLYDIEDDTDENVGCDDNRALRIDREKRCIRGCDTMLTMHFSPMRFVLLQQLWLELIDYLFEGVLGYEVFGKRRPNTDGAMDQHQKQIQEKIMSSQNSNNIKNAYLFGANAEGVRFLRFNIVMDSPLIIVPVGYCSPHHLRFDLDEINIKKKFKGEVESLGCVEPPAHYVQWYNDCDMDFQGLRLTSWCGKQLNISDDPKSNNAKGEDKNRIPMTISIKWPIGPTAFTIVPKWNIHCSISKLRLLFRKKDYALFQHILWNNVGEESRHLDEWNEMQNLPPEDLVAYKKKIMVHFGYDKKDGPPTTYRFVVDIKAMIFHFCLDENNYVADVEGSNMNWSLRKVKDRISRQVLTFNTIHLSQTSENEAWSSFKHLLLPLKDNIVKGRDAEPQLIYRSTSKPSGDNVKFLKVTHACIYLIYPAWIFVKEFFQNLPDPDFMDNDEVLSSIQIADRWYRIGKGDEPETQEAYKSRPLLDRKRPIPQRKTHFQCRVLLETPRIVLVSDSCVKSSNVQEERVVTLGLGHLDFLYRNDSRKESIQKTLFLHNLEIFTGSEHGATSTMKQQQQHSLLYPLCLGAGSSCQFRDGSLVESQNWLSSDVITFQAAYSDMTLAIDVFLKIVSDYRAVNRENAEVDVTEAHNVSELKSVMKETTSVACGGFDLLVIDDSGRHFAGAQELVQVSFSGILYKVTKLPNAVDGLSSVMRLQLHGIELADCLQPVHSPFRVVAMGNQLDAGSGKGNGTHRDDKKKRLLNMNRKIFTDFMTWETYSMVESPSWGYSPSEPMDGRRSIANQSEMRQPFNGLNVIDLYHDISSEGHHQYKCSIRAIVLQWNPSMAIALQRFLGRLRKQAQEKQLVSTREEPTYSSSETKVLANSQGAEIEIESLTLCLNKEHQHRRLLQVTMSKGFIAFHRDEHFHLTVNGHIGDLNAWDSDGNREGQSPICHKNRLVVGVLHNPAEGDGPNNTTPAAAKQAVHDPNERRLLSFKYYSNQFGDRKPEDANASAATLELPDWVRLQVGSTATAETVDDFLSLSVATVRFNHIKERTGELIDYLSNGLPGRGMGATSRAAKGFITKRIKTRSFINLLINSPQLFLPRHRGAEEGVIVCLGDVRLKSWFDEATVDESRNIDCMNLSDVQIPMFNRVPVTPRKLASEESRKHWWRVLSVSIIGLGWNIHREKETPLASSLRVENPVNFHLQVRKPPSDSNLPMIVRCKLTAMELVLCYSEYMLLNAVLKENVTKKVDKKLWDNPEDTFMTDEDQVSGVKYSKNARFVRYGGKHSKNDATRGTSLTMQTDEPSTKIDVKFNLDGIALTLRRDDVIPMLKENTTYDIILLEVDHIDLQMTSLSDGSKSGTAKFRGFALFDVGDLGRIARKSDLARKKLSGTTKIRKPSVFSVIADGYNTEDRNSPFNKTEENEPQLVLAVDTQSSTSLDLGTLKCDCDTAISVRIVLNRMNINPLIRPLREVADFFSGSWPVSDPAIISGKGNMEEKKNEYENETESIHKDEISFGPTDETRSVRGFHLAVVLNYPRVFLVPDESDPSTRALVLRGFTQLNATMAQEGETIVSGKSTIISVKGEVKSLESYINSDPRFALENKRIDYQGKFLKNNKSDAEGSLGVALIEPVTASFKLQQVQRENYPTLREASVKMKAVSTTLSFGDAQLIEVVLSRWKSERELVHQKEVESVDSMLNASDDVHDYLLHSDDLSTTNSFSTIEADPVTIFQVRESYSDDIDVGSNSCGACIPTNGLCIPGCGVPKRTPTPEVSQDRFMMIFTGQRLGLALRKRESSIIVEDVVDASLSRKVRKGDELISIEGKDLAGLPFQTVLNLVNKTERPMKIEFRKGKIDKTKSPMDAVLQSLTQRTNQIETLLSTQSNGSQGEYPPPDRNYGNDAYLDTLKHCKFWTICFKSGFDNGIKIEKCVCGDAAVVSEIQLSTFKKSCANSEHHDYFPKHGSVIIALNKKAISSFEATRKFFNEHTHNEMHAHKDITYSITFLDATAGDWGAIDKVDIVISGIKLTLIDDINGRDMPLLRGTLDSIALKVERGLGVECNSIKVAAPSILSYQEETNDSQRSLQSERWQIGDLSEIITKVCASIEIQLDYYNARIAVWEPLLEPSYMSVELESQKGNKSADRARPGALSVAITDFTQDISRSKQPFVCINLTDAAADLLFTAFYEWKLWHRNLYKESELFADNNAMHKGGSLSNHLEKNTFELKSDFDEIKPQAPQIMRKASTPGRGAAQNAAQAALIFAKRRGVESQKAGVSKPFIFRNKTGMAISYVPEIHRTENQEQGEESFIHNRHSKSAMTTIKDGTEASFHLEPIESTEFSDADISARNENKVRSYDGEFPLLCVHFHAVSCQVQVQSLEHMSVVRIGNTMKSLTVHTGGSNENAKTASIFVVWSVALENNRRIITLSGAVRVSSPRYGLPIEVGVRQLEEISHDQTGRNDIQLVGISSAASPYYIPLWLELSFKQAEIFVRPWSRSASFRWSSASILHLQQISSSSPECEIPSTDLWTWNLSELTTSINCDPVHKSGKHIPPVWLAYNCIYESPDLFPDSVGETYALDLPDREYQMKSIDISSTLSIRNALPTNLQWEVLASDAHGHDVNYHAVDGSLIRKDEAWSHDIMGSGKDDHLDSIPSGHAADIFACNLEQVNLGVRIRCDSESEWSECIPINYVVRNNNLTRLLLEKTEVRNKEMDSVDDPFKTRKIDVESSSGVGTPLTFGIKIKPCIAKLRKNEKVTSYVIGFELVVFSEMWIKNLTKLPIVFGVPSSQIWPASERDSLRSTHESSRKKAAESALFELSSILDFGGKEHGVGDRIGGHDIVPLSKQQCLSSVEEVFEYVEVQNGRTVKQWWAGENNDIEMPDITSFRSLKGTGWIWNEESWNLDSSGDCKATQGCWESCMKLVGNKDASFSPSRTFNRYHRFRRRRWFRRKMRSTDLHSKVKSNSVESAISSFHQPVLDKSTHSKDSKQSKKKRRSNSFDQNTVNAHPESTFEDNDDALKFHFKIGDSAWSSAAVIPPSGAAHGLLRIQASRWPALSKSVLGKDRIGRAITGNSLAAGIKGLSKMKFGDGSLSPKCFDVCFRVSDIESQWGEHSRLLILYPRFNIRNDSENWHMEIKQAGTPDHMAVRLKPGSSKPFYWFDSSLPELLCVRPVCKDNHEKESGFHSWTGGFDISTLGMIPLKVWQNSTSERSLNVMKKNIVGVVRALVELRSGTGGTGISVSIKEELNNGEDSLYRIENHSPFHIWIAQDGVLANPGGKVRTSTSSSGSLVEPGAKIPYGLENPFRQGKYTGRKAASLEELLRLRVGLAPLTTRDGIESMKVISLSFVGANIRLKPAKLRTFFDEDTVVDLMNINVQGFVSSDGPTRVLKFTLIQRDRTASSVIKNSVRMHTDGSRTYHGDDLRMKIEAAGERAISLLRSQLIPKYDPQTNNGKTVIIQNQNNAAVNTNGDCNYSFSASFRGFVFSLVDRVPTEVGVITIRNLEAMSTWNTQRSKEATGALSIGWIQIDNHCPNAQFPVALCPSERKENTETDNDTGSNVSEKPFLSIGVVVAPHHKSNIMCLKGVTISLSDISLATDLAFVMRIQHHLLGISGHLDRCREKKESTIESMSTAYSKDVWQFPDFSKLFLLRTPSRSETMSSRKMYFEGLTFLPFTLKLSVAPAVALTTAQASLEGPEAGAIHAAVRKGDLLIGEKADIGVLGVKVGSKNRTAMSVIRGIFKSILVDSLLRCDDVSMNFSGLAVRNHLSTMPQLKTFIGHHYLSLLKSNVPALIGSLAAFGNPVGLIRGFGDGVTDFVSEPIKGFKRSVEELDPSYVMDGVARGTGSLARHTVGGIVDSASLLTETFSKNMAVLTLDRKYAQRRDRFKTLPGTNTTFVGGVESGVGKLLRGVAEGMIGVVRKPMRGAEKQGVEGFAKGVGKGLLGLVVKPVIGISDAATDLMVGVKGSLQGVGNKALNDDIQSQIRPRRAFYGRDRKMKSYIFVDAISAAIMMGTRIGGENYLSHVDMGGRVAILSVKRFLLLGHDGESELLIRLKNILRVDVRNIPKQDGGLEWAVLIFLKPSRNNANPVEVVRSAEKEIAKDLFAKIQQGMAQL